MKDLLSTGSRGSLYLAGFAPSPATRREGQEPLTRLKLANVTVHVVIETYNFIRQDRSMLSVLPEHMMRPGLFG